MEPQSGKSVVALGLMELLSARVERLGFFRPIVPSADEPDAQIELIRRRYQLAAPYEQMHALSQEEAAAVPAYEELRKRVVEAYKQLEQDCDFVLCEGTDFTSATSALDYGLNASLASTVSPAIPTVAGVLVTGGYPLSETVRRLLESAPFPVLNAEQPLHVAANVVQSVRPVIRAENERKIATALGVFESAVDTAELGQRIALERPPRMTPIMFEYELIERAKADRKHIVLPEGDDERVLRAAEILLRRGVVDLTILGDPKDVAARASAAGVDLGGALVVDPLLSPLRQEYANRYHELRKSRGMTEELALDVVAAPTYFGTMLVAHGAVDGMVSGAVHTTADTIRPAFEIIKSRAGVSVVSSVFFMCRADGVLVYGDCAVNPQPDVPQLADIAISSAETARTFGIEPRIAMLSYATGTSGKGPNVTIVREATEAVRERRPDLLVEGPIQYDAAVDAGVAALKMPESDVAGRATVFIFPDLEAGNVAYKAVQRAANAVAIGPVLQGLRKPVNDLSRGCSVTDIVNTVAITAIQAQENST